MPTEAKLTLAAKTHGTTSFNDNYSACIIFALCDQCINVQTNKLPKHRGFHEKLMKLGTVLYNVIGIYSKPLEFTIETQGISHLSQMLMNCLLLPYPIRYL